MATSSPLTADNTSKQEENDEFEDAVDTFAKMDTNGRMELDGAIKEADVALNLFFNNRFTQAKAMMEPWTERSMYHALGNSTILYIQAVMTFDMSDIETAIAAVKKSVTLCNKVRKKTSIMATLAKLHTKINYEDYTEEEIHAELCYSECLLIRAFLTFIQDENLMSFVKGGLKIRECYKVYRECEKILQTRRVNSDTHTVHFETGVCMGVGAFNLMISLLPSKIMKLLEFVGFSGNKKKGLRDMEKGCAQHAGLRSKLCCLILIAYHSLITYILGLADGDVELATRILQPCLLDHPQGALFLFFKGRLEEVKGHINEAITALEESIESQSEWKQFHHLCYWELMWCHCFKSDWLIAMKYAEKLCHESRWSKATYTYQKASFLVMCPEQTEQTAQHIKLLYSEVPKLKQRIAGKSIPFEKFAVAKSQRFLDQGDCLLLPAVELVYVWNGFNIVGKNPELLERMLGIVETTLSTISKWQTDESKKQYYTDNYCLALLLKGVCLSHRSQYMQAEQCLLEVIDSEKLLVSDHYLVPYALVELAILHLRHDKLDQVKKLLDRAKKNYKGYFLENRLHFRIHAIRLQLNSALNSEGSDESMPASPARENFSTSAGNMAEGALSNAETWDGSLGGDS